jgi:hypothetical protein
LYRLQSHPSYFFWTGHLPDGRQVLASGLSGVLVCFDRHGKLLETRELEEREREALVEEDDSVDWLERMGVEDKPIAVERFRVPGHRTRIEDLPDHLEDFRRNPADPTFEEWERAENPQAIDEWLAKGLFVYHEDGTDFFIDAEGAVDSS